MTSSRPSLTIRESPTRAAAAFTLSPPSTHTLQSHPPLLCVCVCVGDLGRLQGEESGWGRGHEGVNWSLCGLQQEESRWGDRVTRGILLCLGLRGGVCMGVGSRGVYYF